MAKRAIDFARNFSHYFHDANPFRAIESLRTLIDQHMVLNEEKTIAVLNKPPGFVLSKQIKNPQNFIDVLSNTIKEKYKWEKVLRVPLATNLQSGAFMFVSNRDDFENVLRTMKAVFSSNNQNFLTFYGITTYIPMSASGRDVFHLTPKENVDHTISYFEKKSVSNNDLKFKKVTTYQIEHQVIDANPELNVALVKFETSMHNGDGINVYCVKNLCPLLGDHMYSSRVKTLFGKPMMVPDQTKAKSETQELESLVIDRLGLNKYMRELIPLHLHLHDINIPKKFKKQTLNLQMSVPLQGYFKETLNRLNLKFIQK